MLFAGKTLSSVHCVVSASDSEVSVRSKYMFLSLWTSEHLFQSGKPREEKFGSSKRRLFVWCFGDADAQQEAGSWKHVMSTQDAAHQPTLLINSRILIKSVSVFFLYLLMWDFSCSLFLSSSHRPPPCSPPLLSQLFVIRSQKVIQATSTIEVFFFFFFSHTAPRPEWILYILSKARITRANAVCSKPRRSWLLPACLGIRSTERNCVIVATQERPQPSNLKGPAWNVSKRSICS